MVDEFVGEELCGQLLVCDELAPLRLPLAGKPAVEFGGHRVYVVGPQLAERGQQTLHAGGEQYRELHRIALAV
eukprot:4691491-Lingulodinium_polyedra.AAC.1